MTISFPKFRWRWLILWLVIVFHLIAGIGCWRERHDIRVIRENYKAKERKLREGLGEIHEGDSLEKVRRLLPNAYYAGLVDGTGEVRISLPTGYTEDSSCTNMKTEVRFIQMMSGNVASKNGMIMVGKHMDRFTAPTPWYYFKRAWYSSAVTRNPAWW